VSAEVVTPAPPLSSGPPRPPKPPRCSTPVTWKALLTATWSSPDEVMTWTT